MLRRMPPPPAAEIVGGYWGAPCRTDAADIAFPDIADLADDWARAAETGDLAVLAQLSAEAAARTTAARGPGDDPTAGLRPAGWCPGLGAGAYRVRPGADLRAGNGTGRC